LEKVFLANVRKKLAAQSANNMQQNELWRITLRILAFACMRDVMRDVTVTPLHATRRDWLQL